MPNTEKVQNIRRLLFTDLIAEVDGMLAECNDPELDALHDALRTDPGKVLEKLEALKAEQEARAQNSDPEPAEKPQADEKPAAAQQKEQKW